MEPDRTEPESVPPTDSFAQRRKAMINGTSFKASSISQSKVFKSVKLAKVPSFTKSKEERRQAMINAMSNGDVFKSAKITKSVEDSRKAMIRAMSKGDIFKSVRLTDDEIFNLAARQASKLHMDEKEEKEEDAPSFTRTSSNASFRELPSVSTLHIVLVIVATLIAAPSVMVTAHVSTRACWDSEPNNQGLEACGEVGQGKFVKPWFLCWASYVGQLMCLGFAWFNDRRARDSDTSSFGDSESGSFGETFETKRMLLCGCCCGYQIFRNPEEAAEEGIKVKPHDGAVIAVVPTFSDNEGNPLRYKQLPWSRQLGLALFPGAMDLATTALQFLSLLYIPPSLTVMFKSLSIVWVTVFSPLLLPGRKVFRYQYLAVCIALTGACLIGTSAMLQEAAEKAKNGDDDSERPSVVLGIIFALLAGFCAALGSIAMEKMMVELDVDASTLVGVMGLLGFVVSAVLLAVFHFLPGPDHGSVENFGDTLQLLESNWLLLMLITLYATVGSGLNNWTIGEATRILSSVTMLLIRNVCTFLLWGLELLLFYQVAGDRLGSALFLEPGVVKLAGFIVMSTALSIYLGFLKLPIPCLYPPANPEAESEVDSASSADACSLKILPASKDGDHTIYAEGGKPPALLSHLPDAPSESPASPDNVPLPGLQVVDEEEADTDAPQLTSTMGFVDVEQGQAEPASFKLQPLSGFSRPESSRTTGTGVSRLRRANALRLNNAVMHELKRKAAKEWASRRRLSLW